MKTRTLILAGLVLALAAMIVHTLYLAGSFRTIEPHFAGQCRAVEGVTGAEDITLDPHRPVAYLSGYDRRAAMAGEPHQGGLFRYSLDDPQARPMRLNHAPLTDFQPHGISLYTDQQGRQSLFVINHGGGQSTVEIFDFDDGDLVHRRTLKNPLLNSPNDLHAVGHDQVYVTNDHGSRSEFGRTLEGYLRLPLANVVFFDRDEARQAAAGIRFANGINQSPDGLTIYVAALTERGIAVYDRDPLTNVLDYRKTIRLKTSPDNIEVDDQGRLWVGAHPKVLEFVAHIDDPEHLSPSEVLRITPFAEDNFGVDSIYLNAGEQLSGSSVAAVRGSRMLIGSVFEPHFLDCEME